MAGDREEGADTFREAVQLIGLNAKLEAGNEEDTGF